MTDRRYSDDEVAEIFERATQVRTSTPRQLPSAEGLSLAELQSIGREAGIAPELVAEAARTLDQPTPPKVPRVLGFPLAVTHTVELGRKLSDHEWELFVVQLRETFEARGKLATEGSFRHWTNGNLQVLVEPSAGGDRVRFKTLNGTSRSYAYVGILMMAMSAVTVGATFLSGAVDSWSALSGIGGMGLLGAGFFVAGVARLPSWARRRREQMQRLGAKLLGAP